MFLAFSSSTRSIEAVLPAHGRTVTRMMIPPARSSSASRGRVVQRQSERQSCCRYCRAAPIDAGVAYDDSQSDMRALAAWREGGMRRLEEACSSIPARTLWLSYSSAGQDDGNSRHDHGLLSQRGVLCRGRRRPERWWTPFNASPIASRTGNQAEFESRPEPNCCVSITLPLSRHLWA